MSETLRRAAQAVVDAAYEHAGNFAREGTPEDQREHIVPSSAINALRGALAGPQRGADRGLVMAAKHGHVLACQDPACTDPTHAVDDGTRSHDPLCPSRVGGECLKGCAGFIGEDRE